MKQTKKREKKTTFLEGILGPLSQFWAIASPEKKNTETRKLTELFS